MTQHTVEQDIANLTGIVTRAFGKYITGQEIVGVPELLEGQTDWFVFKALVRDGDGVRDYEEDIGRHTPVQPEWVGYRVLDFDHTSMPRDCQGKPTEIKYMK